jgi:hypothetical protein
MNVKAFADCSARALLLTAAFGLPAVAQAQAPKAPYATMAPLAEYLIPDQKAEIALARTAAPASISRDAAVMVLREHGYETAEKGTNGFVCFVDRAWSSPFDSPEFWNPKNRSPTCVNPAAARSILPYQLKRVELVLAGLSKAQIAARLREAVAHKAMPALEPGAMSYMMSRQQYLGDAPGHFHPHLMFYSPRSDGADWGANLPGSPVLIDPLSLSADGPDPYLIFVVPVWEWSDGTPAPMHAH